MLSIALDIVDAKPALRSNHLRSFGTLPVYKVLQASVNLCRAAFSQSQLRYHLLYPLSIFCHKFNWIYHVFQCVLLLLLATCALLFPPCTPLRLIFFPPTAPLFPTRALAAPCRGTRADSLLLITEVILGKDVLDADGRDLVVEGAEAWEVRCGGGVGSGGLGIECDKGAAEGGKVTGQ